MAKIPVYNSLDEKRNYFEQETEEDFFIIETKEKLDRWFRFYSSDFKRDNAVDYIFRGVSEAKYKLYTSAQRLWITDNMGQWKNNYTYKDFIEDMVLKAKSNPLLKKIFDLYDYSEENRDFPIICLLQHYGAPTPLLDWTYNIDCAVYFGTESIARNFNKKSESIENYISIYSIHKKELTTRNELLNLSDISEVSYPSFNSIKNLGDECNPKSNALFILSDFESFIQGIDSQRLFDHNLKIRTTKPLTSIFNQNIIAQEGLLMYNPFQDRPIEKLFNSDLFGEGQNLHLKPFKCFNIHKDLTEYLKRLIAKKGIKKNFIYPHLYDNAKEVKEAVLNRLITI